MEDAVFHIHADMEDRHWWFEGRRRILGRVIARLMAATPDDLIIDVGCGTGGTVAALGGRWRCLGLDSSPLAIDYARAKYPEREFRLGRMPADLRDMAPQAAVYLLMDVLEHVEDDRAFLADLVGLARPGAHIVITVPADRRLWSRHDEVAGHLRRYGPSSLAEAWRGLPVEPRLVSHFNTRLFPPIFALRQLGRLTRGSMGRSDTDFAMPPPPFNRLLTAIFAGEAATVVGALDGGAGYGYGVSMLAVLRKGRGGGA